MYIVSAHNINPPHDTWTFYKLFSKNYSFTRTLEDRYCWPPVKYKEISTQSSQQFAWGNAGSKRKKQNSNPGQFNTIYSTVPLTL